MLIQGDLQKKAGTKKIRTPIEDQETIDTLLIKISRRAPKLVETILDPRTGDLNEDFEVLLNGRSIQQLSGLHTRLKDEDEVTITPAETEE
ncbi:hypothetical protein AKJ48_01290 [candidate division MSBL1 archaeon SCGC-AAA261O19]|uniref:Ubiquitin-like domain-containing protein n=3 Tax=candidate division MSBL1 TaxID=215777 RepID=A0A133V237_9EURY|nr:hypothetical protein AKJ42_00470 [candidate division MSBL1 archaeon SCGC-AAA261C02]KXB04832.1 hypothetical protein AKJ48_01290 [candidate division MSBL1 archaeon SCGC-AAA261O19]KXB09331.1 hypothetical protein AKJ46_00565 [candidate division MSBL1 archaeon SCGC-AAA833K04]